ncbi:unnamed protein product [Cuscuta europaea]|uniref:Uncharacterized protein n=1 Tax=Cuscuta europaea TaxID=41803 RepID=A0A9P1ENT5_CUSEU|nr:unnamed protein product [Cuscuta europaea]
MHELCMVDGFVDITNNLGDMIKYLANEPSVGLFYIQQHTHNAIPNLVNLNKNVVEKSHEVILHMEDLEDSITVMRSMKAFGFSIAEEMNKDIKYSLSVMTASQPKKGLLNITIPRGSFGIGSVSTNSNLDGSDNNSSYLSSVLKSARRKASSFKWAQLETKVPSSPTFAKASTDQLLSFSSKFEEFRATREAELEEWLEGGRCDQ